MNRTVQYGTTSWGCTPKVAVISSSWEKMYQNVSHLTLNVKNEPSRLRGGRCCTVMKSVSAIATTNQNSETEKNMTETCFWRKDGWKEGQSWNRIPIPSSKLGYIKHWSLPVNSQGGCIIAQKLRTVGFDKTRNVETNIPDVDVWNKL